MAHSEQVAFCMSIRNSYPDMFTNKHVIDFGSFDVNGNNRYLFTDCEYLGLDAGPGKNVDVISLAHEFSGPDAEYDVVISTEMLEHDPYWPRSLRNMYRVLKSGGMFLITCAGPGREEHGTLRQDGHWHPAFAHEECRTYYNNLSETDFRKVFDYKKDFGIYGFDANITAPHFDTYFYGIKA